MVWNVENISHKSFIGLNQEVYTGIQPSNFVESNRVVSSKLLPCFIASKCKLAP